MLRAQETRRVVFLRASYRFPSRAAPPIRRDSFLFFAASLELMNFTWSGVRRKEETEDRTEKRESVAVCIGPRRASYHFSCISEVLYLYLRLLRDN